MYKKERLNLIRKRVDQYGEVAVKDLALFLQVTPETVRKDLETLEYDKLITRAVGRLNIIILTRRNHTRINGETIKCERIAKSSFTNSIWRNRGYRWWDDNRSNSSVFK